MGFFLPQRSIRMDSLAVAARKARLGPFIFVWMAGRLPFRSHKARDRELFAGDIGDHLDSLRGEAAAPVNVLHSD